VRWNETSCGDRYAELLEISGLVSQGGSARPGELLASRLDGLARAGGLPRTLRELNVPREDLPALAEDAAKQWTGTFNPRPFDAAAALHLYGLAY
jgi:alcohol dehydrogenase